MLYVPAKHLKVIWITSILASIATLTYVLLTGVYKPTPPYFIPTSRVVNNAIIASIIISILSPSIAEYINLRFIKRVSAEISSLMRDVVSGVSSGLTLTRALVEASRNYRDPIKTEVERVMSRFILGEDFKESVMKMSDKLLIDEVKQASVILASSYESGAKMSDVLSTASEFFSTLNGYREERAAKMKPYLYVFYMAVFIFLVVSYFSLKTFIIPMLTSPSLTMLPSAQFDPEYFKSAFLYLAVIESIVAGLLGGKVVDAKLSAGLIHSVILTTVTLIAFNLFIY